MTVLRIGTLVNALSAAKMIPSLFPTNSKLSKKIWLRFWSVRVRSPPVHKRTRPGRSFFLFLVLYVRLAAGGSSTSWEKSGRNTGGGGGAFR